MRRKEEIINMDELVGRIFSLRKNPGAPPEIIEDFQARHGIELPPSFRSFLTRMNGGELNQSLQVLGISTKGTPEELTLDTFARNSIIRRNEILPFAEGGIMFAFDLKKLSPNGEYPIIFWNDQTQIRKATSHTQFDKWLQEVLEQDM